LNDNPFHKHGLVGLPSHEGEQVGGAVVVSITNKAGRKNDEADEV
jgi:hypothetical protein